MRWTEIIVHHSASDDHPGLDLDDIRRWHMEGRGWSDIGYHFVVEQIGDTWVALMGRPLYRGGAHCVGHNSKAIGICFVGNYSLGLPSNRALEAGARLIAGLCSSLDIPTGHVFPHRAFSATECPGNMFPFTELIDKVKAMLA